MRTHTLWLIIQFNFLGTTTRVAQIRTVTTRTNPQEPTESDVRQCVAYSVQLLEADWFPILWLRQCWWCSFVLYSRRAWRFSRQMLLLTTTSLGLLWVRLLFRPIWAARLWLTRLTRSLLSWGYMRIRCSQSWPVSRALCSTSIWVCSLLLLLEERNKYTYLIALYICIVASSKRILKISNAPKKAKSAEPAYSQVVSQNRIDR